MTVVVRPVDTAEELASAFDLAGAQVRVPIHHTDHNRFEEIAGAFPTDRELLIVAEADHETIGVALGFRPDADNVTLRLLGVLPAYRDQGVGRSLLESFEAGALRLGASRISLGAGEDIGFYVRNGYQTMLLVQWVYDEARFEQEAAAILDGPAAGMASRRSSFRDVPQLFIDLDEPNPAIRATVAESASGAHVGYCMTKVLNPVRSAG